MGIKDIEDISRLKEMFNETISRGMKQRIKKKIQRLTQGDKSDNKGEIDESDTHKVTLSGMENPNQKASVVKLVQTPEKKLTAREKIDNIMKKRDKKLEEKTKVSSKALLND